MQQDIIIKFCVVGQSAVGKTSMLYQYVHHKFDQKIRPTIGCDFNTKLKSSIDNKPVRLQLWDIAGQQRFSAVSKMYLRGALGCLIVCSSTQNSTLDQTLKWKRIIEQNSNDGNHTTIPCLLVQNKSDLIQQNQIQQFQTKQYLDQFAQTHGFCGSIQCSAKTNVNVEECFQILLDETIKRGLLRTNPVNSRNSRQFATSKKQQTIKLTNNSKEDKKKKKKCC